MISLFYVKKVNKPWGNDQLIGRIEIVYYLIAIAKMCQVHERQRLQPNTCHRLWVNPPSFQQYPNFIIYFEL